MRPKTQVLRAERERRVRNIQTCWSILGENHEIENGIKGEVRSIVLSVPAKNGIVQP